MTLFSLPYLEMDYCYDPNFDLVSSNMQVTTMIEEPELNFKGSNYCSSDNKCSLCEGNCDS